MSGTFDDAFFINLLLHFQQAVKAPVHREIREFPFDDPGEPYKGTDIIKPDLSEEFFRSENLKTCVPESVALGCKIKIRERFLRIRKDHLNQIPVIPAAHLLGDKQTAGFQYPG